MSEMRDPAPPGDDDLLPEDNEPFDEGEPTDEAEPTDEGEAPEGDLPAEPAEPQGRLERRPGRIERARAEARREREARIRLEAELAAMRRQPPPQIDPMAAQRAHQAELERIQLMPPDQQVTALFAYNEQRALMREQARQAHFEDQLDRQAFAQLVRSDPTARRLEGQVEQIRRENPTVGREVILDYLVGKEVREKARAAASRQRRVGRAAVQRETTQPGSPRSTEANPRARGETGEYAAYRRRLATYRF